MEKKNNGGAKTIFSAKTVPKFPQLPEQVMRVLSDNCMNPSDSALPHLFHEAAYSKPFQVCRKYGLRFPRCADGSSLSWSLSAHDNQSRSSEDGQRYRRGRQHAAKNPNPPIPSEAFAHRIPQLLPTSSFDRGRRHL